MDGGFRVIGGDDADGRALKNAALDELLEEGYEGQEEEFLHLLSSYWRKKKDAALRKIFLTTYNALRDRADYSDFLKKNLAGYTEEDFEGVCTRLLAFWQEKCRYYRELVEDERAYFLAQTEVEAQLALCDELIEWLDSYEGIADYFAAAKIPKPAFTVNRLKKPTPEKSLRKERLALLKERIADMHKEEFAELKDRREEEARFLASGRTAAALAKYLLRFDEKYEALKREKGVLDYNDLEHKALALLQSSEIAAEMQKRYRYVFVDEYQDVNPVQEEIISRLSSENLFLVGDVKQSIYGFRGSKSKFFVQKQTEMEKGNGQSLFMSYNFRSADRVLDAVNSQFVLAMTKKVCDVDYARGSVMEKGGRYALNSGNVQVHFVGREEKGTPPPRGIYSVLENTAGREERASRTAKLMAQIIREELNGYLDDPATGEKRKIRYADIAILTRKKGGDIVEEVEALSDLGLPVSTISAVNVCDFTEVKALMDILSLLDNAEQDIPLCSALLSGMGNLTVNDLTEIRLAYRGLPFRAACKKYAAEGRDALAEKLNRFYEYFYKLRVEACVLTAGEVLAKILADTQMEAGLLSRKNGVACLKRIRRFLEEASSFDGDTVHEFLAHLRNLDYKIEYCENGGEDSVKVLTMHSSKGLEFPVVLLANLNQPFRGGETPDVYVEEEYGLAPRAFDAERMLKSSTLLRRLCEVKEGRSSRADELNLYYVAMTRAEQRLHMLFTERTALPDVKYAKSFADFTDFCVWEPYIVEDSLFDLEKLPVQALLRQADEGVVQKILRAYGWQYSHAGYENLPVKSSPTQLMSDGKYTPALHFKDYAEGEEGSPTETGADRELAVREGTAYHAFLEHFDFSMLVDGEGNPVSVALLEELVETRLAEGKVGEADVALLERDKLVEILSNPVFYDLQGMRLYKEQQFLVSLPVKDTYAKKEGAPDGLTNKEDGEEMIFQGAIDLLAVGEEVRIIDYKYSTRGAEELRKHYKPQLDLYRLAVAKIMKIPAAEIKCSIVNIKRGFQVDMD